MNMKFGLKRGVLMISALLMAVTVSAGPSDEKAKADDDNALMLVPDLDSDKPLDLSDGKDKAARYFPIWNESDVYQEYEGSASYNLDLGYDTAQQQLFEELPGIPVNKAEVGRVILIDLNKDGYTDALICLGRYGDIETLLFDAYVWDPEEFGGRFMPVENFRNIPNPGIDKESSNIIGRKGADREVWSWTGKDRIEKTQN